MGDWIGLAREIVDLIGEPAAVKLLAARGGTEVFIPDQVTDSKLSSIVGLPAAVKLREHFGPGPLRLPTGSARGAGARRARAMQMLREGATTREVAMACDLHTRTVENYSAQMQRVQDARQTGFNF